MVIASFDRVPLAGLVVEPSSPLGEVRAVLGMAGVVLDEPEAPLRLKAEGLGVVLHRVRVERGSDGSARVAT